MPSFAAIADQITISELRARGSVKWTRGGPGVIGAFVAEMDFGAAPPIKAALRDVINRADFGYLSDRARRAGGRLRPLAGRPLRLGGGPSLDPSAARPDHRPEGRDHRLLRAGQPGHPADPRLHAVPEGPRSWDARSSRSRWPPRPTVAPSSTWPASTPRSTAAAVCSILCNPCNPVGRVYEAAELAAVADVVTANHGRVFADEVHAPLIYPGGAHIPYASISELTAAHTVTATSASKGWNLPGLKCGQLILSNDKDAALWSEDAYSYEHGASTVGVQATAAAYRDGGPWLDEVVGYLDGSRRLLADLLREQLPESAISPPRAPISAGSTAATCSPRRVTARPARPTSSGPRRRSSSPTARTAATPAGATSG